MKIKHLLLALVASALAMSAFAANRPSGYVTICKEGQTCSVAGSTTVVAFGRGDKFIYKTLKGSFSCSQATFGGRIEGGNNECSIRPASSSASTKSASSVVSSVKPASSSSSSVATLGSCKAGSIISGKMD